MFFFNRTFCQMFYNKLKTSKVKNKNTSCLFYKSYFMLGLKQLIFEMGNSHNQVFIVVIIFSLKRNGL